MEASAGENPGIFTEATCHLRWIAEQYGLRLGAKLEEVAGRCAGQVGELDVRNVGECRTWSGVPCNFSASYQPPPIPSLETLPIKMDKCRLLGLEG